MRALMLLLVVVLGTGCAHYHAFGPEGARSYAYAPERRFGDYIAVVANGWSNTTVRVYLDGVVVHEGLPYGSDPVRIVLPVERRASYGGRSREVPTTHTVSVQIVGLGGEILATQCRTVTVGRQSSYRGAGTVMWTVQEAPEPMSARRYGSRRAVAEGCAPLRVRNY
jgi:hypothetical protein